MANVAGITRESRGNHAELCGAWHYKTMIENQGNGVVFRQIQCNGDKSEKEYCQNTVQKDNYWGTLNGELCELNEFIFIHKRHKRIQKIFFSFSQQLKTISNNYSLQRRCMRMKTEEV